MRSVHDHKQPLLFSHPQQFISNCVQSKLMRLMIILVMLTIFIGIIISVILLDPNHVDVNFIYRGSKMLQLLSQDINTINNETFALSLKNFSNEYESNETKLFSSLYDAIKTNNILSILEVEKPIYGQYPNLLDNKCKLLLHNISFTAKDDNLQNKMQSIFEDIIKYSMNEYQIDFNFTRFDLFHGHFFYNSDIKASGILFHAMEYPQLSLSFPYHLGFCQQNSTCNFNRNYWSFRNILLLMFGIDKENNCKDINTQLWLLNTSNDSYISINVMQKYAMTIFADDIGQEVGELYDFNDTQVLWQTFEPIQ